MDGGYRLWPWFVDNWSRVGLPLVVLSLCSLPIFWTDDHRWPVLLYASLPIYMIHQYEEHAHGRFVATFNATIGRGQGVLTKTSAFWFNLLEVWVAFVVSFYLARYVAVGFAFVPVYTMLVNGLTHVIAAVSGRGYNPGLATALALFLPYGLFLLVYFLDRTDDALAYNALGLALAVVGHAVIVGYALRRRRALALEGAAGHGAA
jgi:hypothetical protein